MSKQSQSDGPIQSWSTKANSGVVRRKKRVITTVLFVILCVAIYYLYPTIRSQYNNNFTVGKDCTDSKREECTLLNESVKLFDASKVKDLSRVVDNIRKTRDYSQDPNLMYVLVTYDINRSDGDNGRKDLNQLKKVYTKAGYDKVLVQVGAVKPSDLEEKIKFLEDQAMQVKKNNWGVKTDGTTQQGVPQ